MTALTKLVVDKINRLPWTVPTRRPCKDQSRAITAHVRGQHVNALEGAYREMLPKDMRRKGLDAAVESEGAARLNVTL